MTTWVEKPEGGRARGPRGLLRAWFEVVVHPRRFYRNGIAPGDQAPGLVFGVLIALVFTATRIAVDPTIVPAVFGGRAGSIVVALAGTAIFLAPATLHLTAALQTVVLILGSIRVGPTLGSILSAPTDRSRWQLVTLDRAGVSETVQILAYATAPCVAAGVPIPEVRVACTGYAAYLLALGLSEVHEFPPLRATLASFVATAVVFGYAFGGFDALAVVLAQWYIV